MANENVEELKGKLEKTSNEISNLRVENARLNTELKNAEYNYRRVKDENSNLLTIVSNLSKAVSNMK